MGSSQPDVRGGLDNESAAQGAVLGTVVVERGLGLNGKTGPVGGMAVLRVWVRSMHSRFLRVCQPRSRVGSRSSILAVTGRTATKTASTATTVGNATRRFMVPTPSTSTNLVTKTGFLDEPQSPISMDLVRYHREGYDPTSCRKLSGRSDDDRVAEQNFPHCPMNASRRRFRTQGYFV